MQIFSASYFFLRHTIVANNILKLILRDFIMQDIDSIKENKNSFKIDDFSIEDQQRLIDAFLWLIDEDKKQNPEIYQLKKT